jgi:hypothetical protein
MATKILLPTMGVMDIRGSKDYQGKMAEKDRSPLRILEER